MKVFIMSSIHKWDDVRIFYKEAISLAQRYEVELHAVANFKYKKVNNVNVYGLPRLNRYLRFLNWITLFYRAITSNVAIIHLHDPELLLLGYLIKIFKNKAIIYDVHEDFPAAILSKDWINVKLRKFVSLLCEKYEKFFATKIDALLFAEFYYKENFNDINVLKADVVNYPVFTCTNKKFISKNEKFINIVYAGGISESRGALTMVKAMLCLKPNVKKRVRMFLIGEIDHALSTKIDQIISHDKEVNIVRTGRLSLPDVYDYYSKAHIGLAVLWPEKNYVKSLATKIYDYMSAGIPVIASNFPSWVELVQDNRCGINVNPFDPKEIAEAIEFLVYNHKQRKVMGENGYKSYTEKYNWEIEARKLLAVYDGLENKWNELQEKKKHIL